MKIKLLMIIILMNSVSLLSQTSLEELYQKAMDNYPTAKLNGLYEQRYSKELEIINHDYYPKIQFFGQVSYQSSVPQLDIELPIPNFSIPKINHDQYKFGVNIDQIIWDGGIISSRRELAEVDTEIEINQNEVDLYKVRRMIDDLAFGIMMLDKQLILFNYKFEILKEKQKTIKSAVENGMMLPVNVDLIEIEMLSTETEEMSVNQERSKLIRSINVLCGTDYKDNLEIKLPDVLKKADKGDVQRPEYMVFSSSKMKFEKMKDLSSSAAMPKISAYAQAGYFQPGYNMFDPDFEAVYMVGLRLGWSPLDIVKYGNEEEKLTLAQEIISQKEKAFSESVNIERRMIETQIEKLKIQSENVKKEIELRKNVVTKTNARFENDDLLFSDYIQELNAFLLATLKKDILDVEFIRSNYELLTIDGMEK